MSNFGAIPVEFANEQFARIVVLPVPYDETSTWLKGADKGPAAILAASANMELFDIETGSEVYRRGIFTAEPVTENRTPEAMVAAVRERVSTARERQLARQGKPNALLSVKEIEVHCGTDTQAEHLARQAISRLGLSARAYHRILKVARSIADLAGAATISAAHVAEAVQYRRLEHS